MIFGSFFSYYSFNTFSTLVVWQAFHYFVVSGCTAFVAVVLNRIAVGRCAVWGVLLISSTSSRRWTGVRLVGDTPAVRWWRTLPGISEMEFSSFSPIQVINECRCWLNSSLPVIPCDRTLAWRGLWRRWSAVRRVYWQVVAGGRKSPYVSTAMDGQSILGHNWSESGIVGLQRGRLLDLTIPRPWYRTCLYTCLVTFSRWLLCLLFYPSILGHFHRQTLDLKRYYF